MFFKLSVEIIVHFNTVQENYQEKWAITAERHLYFQSSKWKQTDKHEGNGTASIAHTCISMCIHVYMRKLETQTDRQTYAQMPKYS